jgi:hypothetical protein
MSQNLPHPSAANSIKLTAGHPSSTHTNNTTIWLTANFANMLNIKITQHFDINLLNATSVP